MRHRRESPNERKPTVPRSSRSTGPVEAGPGSPLRPGATCSWPATACDRIAARECPRRRSASAVYCAGSKAVPSRPSSSTPIEKSLQFARPRQADGPACQARRSQDTNCSSSPSRRITKWDETSQAADRLEVGMRIPVEPVGEQALDGVVAVLARRQADRMHEQQVDGHARRAVARSWEIGSGVRPTTSLRASVPCACPPSTACHARPG